MKIASLAILTLVTAAICCETASAGHGHGHGQIINRLKSMSNYGRSNSGWSSNHKRYSSGNSYRSQSYNRPTYTPSSSNSYSSNSYHNNNSYSSTYSTPHRTVSPSYSVQSHTPVYHETPSYSTHTVSPSVSTHTPATVYVSPSHTVTKAPVSHKASVVTKVSSAKVVPSKVTKEIRISCPKGQSGQCSYTLITAAGTNFDYTIAGGKKQILVVEKAWKIKFRPTDDSDWVGYVLKPGHHYALEHDDDGHWQLYEVD